MLAALGLSLADYDVLSPPKFAGLRNYGELLGDGRVLVVYRNTLFFVVGLVSLDAIVALILALGVNRPMHAVFRYVFRTCYFFPVLTSLASVSLVWAYIYHADFGVLNYYLRQIGIPGVPWVTSSQWAIPSLVLLSLWKTVGFNFILFLAGLQNIPRHLYEAARIDGANSWNLFCYITMPMLTPTLFFAIVIALINGFQIFDSAFILTQGGPGDATRTVVMYIYENAFRFFRMGYASTIALSLFLVILTLTIIQFRVGKVWVFYQ